MGSNPTPSANKLLATNGLWLKRKGFLIPRQPARPVKKWPITPRSRHSCSAAMTKCSVKMNLYCRQNMSTQKDGKQTSKEQELQKYIQVEKGIYRYKEVNGGTTYHERPWITHHAPSQRSESPVYAGGSLILFCVQCNINNPVKTREGLDEGG